MGKHPFVAACLLILSFCGAPTSYAQRADLGASPARCDFGRVRSGEEAMTVITLTNTHRQAVFIKTIRSTCGCVVAKTDSRTIPAGGSVKLTVVLDTLGRVGAYRGSVVVATDLFDGHLQMIPVVADIFSTERALTASPAYIGLGEINPGQTMVRRVVVSRRNRADIGAVRVSAKQGGVKIVEDSALSSERNRYFVLSLRAPEGFRGMLEDEIRIVGRDERDFLRIAVSAQVNPRVRLRPDTVLLQRRKNEYRLKASVTDGAVPALMNYEFEGKGFEVTDVEWNKEASEAVLHVAVSADVAEIQEGRIVFHLKDDAMPVEVRLIGFNVTSETEAKAALPESSNVTRK